MVMSQALLLAFALGWTIVEAKEPWPAPPSYYPGSTGTTATATTTSTAPIAPIVHTEVSHESLQIPGSKTSSEVYITDESPISQHTQTSLDTSTSSVVTRTSIISAPPEVGYSESSLEAPTYFSPITQRTQTSLDGPTASATTHTLIPAIPKIGHSDSSLDTPTYFSPITQHSQTSLDLPTSQTTTRTYIPLTPVTGHSESSLDAPTYFSPRVHETQTSLDRPTAAPVLGISKASLDLPTDAPTTIQTSPSDTLTTEPPNLGAILMSIASLVDIASGQDLAQYLTSSLPNAIDGTAISPGAPGIVVAGTTYSAPQAGAAVIYVNGVSTAATAVPNINQEPDLGAAILSVIGVTGATPTSTGSSTFTTSVRQGVSQETSTGRDDSTASTTSEPPAQQTTNAASALAVHCVVMGAALLGFALL